MANRKKPSIYYANRKQPFNPKYKTADIVFNDLELAKKFVSPVGTVHQKMAKGKRKLVFELKREVKSNK